MAEAIMQVTGDAAPDDVVAVVACLSDYYDGYFEGDAERMQRCLHPELVKRSVGSGFVRTMSADDMVRVTAEGEGRALADSDREWRVEALDLRGDIATAVVVSVPFVDYVHVGRIEGVWRIINVLWALR